MAWNPDAAGGESERVKFAIVRYTRGAGLHLGVQDRKAFPHFIGVATPADAVECSIKPDIVDDCVNIEPIANTLGCDFIFASHLLHRLDDPAAALATWWEALKDGGHLVLHEPLAGAYPADALPDAKRHLSLNDLVELVRSAMDAEGANVGFDIIVAEDRTRGSEYSSLLVLRKDPEGMQRLTVPPEFRRKSACIVRHGGYGDQLQAACLFPELKRQGYHLTVLTDPSGRDIIEHDPHVDEWFVIDRNQVPNHELIHFWREVAGSYDKFINLNESVEGIFLAWPGRAQFMWPHSVRHMMMNKNYGEFAAALAEVPFAPEGRFYPTPDEVTSAKDVKRELTVSINSATIRDAGPYGVVLQPPYVILWCLSGSSPHKANPHQDAVMQMVLARLKRAVFVLVGDQFCKMLEVGWTENSRVRCLSGEISIRQTLALAQHVNLVIGPETGVLNSVAYNADVAKVVMLSHSSHENLTKHWLNTTVIEGKAPCYPCHQLHITNEFCPYDERTHAAICQQNMSAAEIYRPIDADYTGWVRAQMVKASLREAAAA